MPLSWNEIKTRAVAFTNEWKDEVSEDAEAKSFWDDFFNVFGISRRRVGTVSLIKYLAIKKYQNHDLQDARILRLENLSWIS